MSEREEGFLFDPNGNLTNGHESFAVAWHTPDGEALWIGLADPSPWLAGNPRLAWESARMKLFCFDMAARSAGCEMGINGIRATKARMPESWRRKMKADFEASKSPSQESK